MSNPNMRALQRQQLDAQLGTDARLRNVARPEPGWIATIRNALGMTLRQLAARLGVTPQAVADLEKSERAESITLASLRKAADALDCDVVVALVPRRSLQATVERQAQAKAGEMRNRVAHTMGLEAQDAGVPAALEGDEQSATALWTTTFAKRLWD